jgi:hypothetical protein
MDKNDKNWLIAVVIVYGLIGLLWILRKPTIQIPLYIPILVAVGILSMGMFMVALLKHYDVGFNISNFFKMFTGTKRWTLILLILTLIHFDFCWNLQEKKIGFGVLNKNNNKYEVVNHSEIIRVLTESEYYELKKFEHLAMVSGFSIFFAFGLMILNKKISTQQRV